MPNYSIDNDPDYWQAPERFRKFLDLGPTIGVKGSIFALGDANDDNTPVAVVLKMEPGYVLTRHAHPCYRFEVIARGTLHSEDGSIHRPGDVMTAEPNEFYGPKVAGEEGCTTIEIFAKATGTYLRMTEDEKGNTVVMNLLDLWQTAFAEHIKRHDAKS